MVVANVITSVFRVKSFKSLNAAVRFGILGETFKVCGGGGTKLLEHLLDPRAVSHANFYPSVPC